MKNTYLVTIGATFCLVIAAIVTGLSPARADWSSTSPSGCIREPEDYIGAVTLGQMAYQGMFASQGIPSAAGLKMAYDMGKVTPQSVVQAAIKACILSNKYQLDQNQGYLNDLNQELRSLAQNN